MIIVKIITNLPFSFIFWVCFSNRKRNVSKYLFTLLSLTVNKHIHLFLSTIRSMRIIECEHCDVDAYYRLTIEDFNREEMYSVELCMKCVKIEALKAIEDFPVTRSLKIEPLFSILQAPV